MAETTKEQIKAQKTISELLTEIGKKAAAIQETFEKQRDAAKDVESVITAQKNKMEGFEKNRDASAKVIAAAQQKQIDLETEFMHAIRDGNLEQSYAIEERIKATEAEVDEAKKLNQIAQDGVDLARTKLEVQEDTEEETNDEFENLYKGQVSKSGIAILPSKRTRRIPEVKKASLADEALSELKAEQPEIKEENLETEEAPLELSEEASAADETPAATEEENKSE